MLTTLGPIALILASIGGLPGRPATCCSTCGVESAEVFAEIRTLQTAPSWKARVSAAHDLRGFDWRCHPAVIDALAGALLGDCNGHVRKEAAQSLKKIAACTPTAHAALKKAADCDPKLCNRLWARCALGTIRRKCTGDCDVCGSGPIVAYPVVPIEQIPIEQIPTVIPGEPSFVPPIVPPGVPVETSVRPILPEPESPPPPPQPGRSPFVEPLPAESGPPLDGPIREARRTVEKPSKAVAEAKAEPKDDPPPRRTRPAGILSGLRGRLSGR